MSAATWSLFCNICILSGSDDSRPEPDLIFKHCPGCAMGVCTVRVQGGCVTEGGCSCCALGENLTSVLKVLLNILCVFVTLPWQGQPSSRRRHSSSMHISVCKNEMEKELKKYNRALSLKFFNDKKYKSNEPLK